jgi:hypothetical protein
MSDLILLLRKCESELTPGPWRSGHPGGRCFMDHRHGQGDCDYQTVWYEDSGDIYPADATHESQPIAGMWDYEEGGIRRGEDSESLVALRNSLPDIIAALASNQESEPADA